MDNYRILCDGDKYYPQYKALDIWFCFMDIDKKELCFTELCKAYKWIVKLIKCEQYVI